METLMKRFWSTVLFATLFIFALAVPNRARSSSLASIGVGFAANHGAELRDGNEGVSLNGYVAGPLTTTLGWRAEISMDRLGPRDENWVVPSDVVYTCEQVDCGSGASHLSAGVQLGGFGDSKSEPYGFVTVGSYSEDYLVSADVARRPGMGFGGGLNFRLDDNWSLGAQVELNALWPDVGDVEWYSSSSVHAVLRW